MPRWDMPRAHADMARPSMPDGPEGPLGAAAGPNGPPRPRGAATSGSPALARTAFGARPLRRLAVGLGDLSLLGQPGRAPGSALSIVSIMGPDTCPGASWAPSAVAGEDPLTTAPAIASAAGLRPALSGFAVRPPFFGKPNRRTYTDNLTNQKDPGDNRR